MKEVDATILSKHITLNRVKDIDKFKTEREETDNYAMELIYS